VIPATARKIHYEEVPSDLGSAFTFREFNWPRFPFNWHFHPEVELTLIGRGRGLRFVADSVEEFSAGDVCLIGSNTPHCWASHKDADPGVRSLVIQFRPESWGEPFWNLPELRGIRRLLDAAKGGLEVKGPARREVEQLFLVLEQQSRGSLQRFDTLLEILHCISQSAELKRLATAASEPLIRSPASRKLGQILGYIHNHLGPDLMQHEVARAAGLSPATFSQYFRRSMGTSYVDYVNGLKIRNACRALIETDQRITDIAFAAGFNNLSHFNAQFRRLRRLTPKAFRRQVLAARSGPIPGELPEETALPAGQKESPPPVIHGDVTVHGPGVLFEGVRVGTEDSRPWLKAYALCPALARYEIVHAGIVEAPVPYRIQRANQTSSYFLACFDGRGRVLVDGRWRVIREGLACLLPAHVHNAFEALPGAAWRFAYVCYQQQPDQRPIILASSPVVKEFEVRRLKLAIEGLMSECRTHTEPGPVDHWLELVHHYVLAFAQPVAQDSQLPFLWQQVASRLHEPWTVHRLARQAGLVRDHLQRACLKELGRGPLEHLAHLRMRRATELLTTTNLTVKTIAQTVGYSDPAVFSRDFKSSVGCQPTDYRHRARHSMAGFQ
jgi:AraC-like DNA-binding protein/quercetin dioxygenase-like cupin family protein